MSTSYGPPFCMVCKMYKWTTDNSDIYRCRCDDKDIEYFKESLAEALGIDLEERYKNLEEEKD